MKPYFKHAFALLLCVGSLLAQTTVVLAPVPQLQFFDSGGRPLAFGCVFSYNSGTVTPLTTYTDFSGNTPNSNPVILNAGGSANIWLKAGIAYTITVKSSGGTNCSSGSQRYSVSGISGGVSQLTSNVTYSPTPTFNDISQNQLFTMTLTGNAASLPMTAVGVNPPGIVIFQITQDNIGGHTFAWPANVTGGAIIGAAANQVTTQEFVWTGTSAYALGPAVIGNGPSLSTGPIFADTISASAITATSQLVINGGGALTTSSHSGTGNICMTSNCAMTSPNLGFPTINSVKMNGAPLQTICNDGSTTSVNANTTAKQILKTCGIPTAALNAVGKSFRFITGNTETTSTGNQTAWFGLGTDATLGTYPFLTSQLTGAGAYQDVTTIVCTTVTTGATGTISCVSTAAINTGATSGSVGGGVVFSSQVLDLTGPVFIGRACQFSSGSASNICNNTLLVAELLN